LLRGLRETKQGMGLGTGGREALLKKGVEEAAELTDKKGQQGCGRKGGETRNVLAKVQSN